MMRLRRSLSKRARYIKLEVINLCMATVEFSVCVCVCVCVCMCACGVCMCVYACVRIACWCVLWVQHVIF